MLGGALQEYKFKESLLRAPGYHVDDHDEEDLASNRSIFNEVEINLVSSS